MEFCTIFGRVLWLQPPSRLRYLFFIPGSEQIRAGEIHLGSWDCQPVPWKHWAPQEFSLCPSPIDKIESTKTYEWNTMKYYEILWNMSKVWVKRTGTAKPLKIGSHPSSPIWSSQHPRTLPQGPKVVFVEKPGNWTEQLRTNAGRWTAFPPKKLLGKLGLSSVQDMFIGYKQCFRIDEFSCIRSSMVFPPTHWQSQTASI